MTSQNLPLHLLPLALPVTFFGHLQAADVNAITNNGDWIAAATWSDATIPAAGNAYFVPSAIAVDGYTGASTNTTPTTRTFGGGSLTVQDGGTLYLDSNHGTSYPDWNYTISNLTLENGSSLHVRGGAGTDFFLTNGFTVAAESTIAIRHSAGSYDQRFRLGAVSGPSTATIEILGTHNPSNGGTYAKDNYATVANSSYAGDWFLDYTETAAGKNVRLRADAANALGTGGVTLSRQAILENNASGGLNSLTGIELQQTTSTANLGSGWTSPAGALTLTEGNLLLGSGFTTSSFASLSHANGFIQFDLGSSAANADKIVLSGNYDVTALGPIDLYLKADPGSSTFDLITYGGTLTGTPDILVAPSAPSRLVASVSTGDGSNDKVTVSFSGSTADLVWKGNDVTNPNHWDLNATSNFDNAGSPDKFLVIDSVTFDDTAASFTPNVIGTLVPKAVTFNHTTAYTLGGSGVISGNGALVKDGTGSLTITPANTFTGNATLNAGKIRIGNNAALGTGTLAINGGILSSDGGTARTLANPVTVGASFTLGDATDTGAVNLSGAVTLAANAVVTIESATAMNASGAIGGTGTLELRRPSGAQGTFNLTNTANNFAGDLTVTSGRLRFAPGTNSDAGLGNPANKIIFNGDPVATFNNNEGTASLQQATGVAATIGATREVVLNTGKEGTLHTWGGQTMTVNAPVTGGGILRKEDSGTLLLAGNNSYSGGTKVTNGIVRVTSNTGLGNGDVTVGAVNNTLTARVDLEGVTVDNNFVLNSLGLTGYFGPLTAAGGTLSTVNGDVTISSGVGNGGHLASNGVGSILRINGEIIVPNGTVPNVRQGTVILAGGGSYPRLDQGQGDLKIGANNGISPVAQLRLGVSGAGTFDLNGFNQTLSQINKPTGNAATVTNTAVDPSVLTLDGTVDHSFSGLITEGAGSGGLSLVKKGNSIFTLAAASSYTGSTSVEGGTLRINGATGISAVTVASAGTLGGTGPINGNISVAGTLAPGNSAGLLFTNGSVTFGPGSDYAWEIADWTGTTAGTEWDLLDALDLAFTATPAEKLTIAISGTAANFSESNKSFEIARSSTPVTGFDPAAILIDDSAFIGSGTWAVQLNGNSVELVYTAGSGTPFSNWAITNGIAGADPDLDDDGDGIANGIEFVIGGDPSGPGSNSNHLLPTVTTDATYFYFTYRRTDDAQGMPEGQRPYVEYGSDLTLAGWTEAIPGEPLANPVFIQEVGGTPDLVTVRIPRALATGGKLFARLRVDID